MAGGGKVHGLVPSLIPAHLPPVLQPTFFLRCEQQKLEVREWELRLKH